MSEEFISVLDMSKQQLVDELFYCDMRASATNPGSVIVTYDAETKAPLKAYKFDDNNFYFTEIDWSFFRDYYDLHWTPIPSERFTSEIKTNYMMESEDTLRQKLLHGQAIVSMITDKEELAAFKHKESLLDARADEITEGIKQVLKERNPELYKIIMEGVNMDDEEDISES